jgi:transposase-like protein
MSQERAKRRRVRRSAEERQALVAAWQSSGLSASAFERREGLTPWSLARWKRRAETKASRAKPEPRPSISFAPVHITKSQAKTVVVERMLAEVLIGHDVRVRVVDGADLEQVTLLVRALAGGLAC